MSDLPPYATRLQRLLAEERITQASVSRATGINEGRLSLFANGKLRPGPMNARKIAEAIGWQGDAMALFLADEDGVR